MAQMIANAIRQAGTNFVESLSVFLPRMVTTLAIIIVGWLIAMLLRTMVRAVAGWLRINVAAERFGVTPLLKTADLPPADVLLGAIVFWLVWLGFLLSGIDVLGFTSLQGLLGELLGLRAATSARRGDSHHWICGGEFRLARYSVGSRQWTRAVTSAAERSRSLVDSDSDGRNGARTDRGSANGGPDGVLQSHSAP
jgi:hypothetical protein